MKRLSRYVSLSSILLISFVLAILRPADLYAEAVKINEVTYAASDFKFAGPDRLQAGVTNLYVTNEGPGPHHVVLVKLSEGKTAEDLKGALTLDSSGRLPDWAKYMGGPNAITPGEVASATVNLTEGRYALICVIPDQNGMLHAALGMIKSLQVTKGSETFAVVPEADLTIEMADFVFKIPKPITAGRHVIRAVNTGTMPHEAAVVRLDPGATAMDITTAFAPGADDPPPGVFLGGTSPIEQGDAATFSANFLPGRYALMCFMPDLKSGKPHSLLGMATEFTVK
jgi:hypothetical protein